MKYKCLLLAILFVTTKPFSTAQQGHANEQIDALLNRALANDLASLKSLENYIYTETEVNETYDKENNVTKTKTTKILEHFVIDGTPYERILQSKGNDLSDDQSEKQEKRIQQALDRSNSLTAEQRKHQESKVSHHLKDEIDTRKDIVNGYIFTKLDEEQCGKDTCMRLQAEPKPGYAGQSPNHSILRWLHGTLLVDEQAGRWVDIDIHPIKQIGAGPFYIKPDCSLHFQEKEVDTGVWAITLSEVRNDLRLIFYRENNLDRSVYSDFRKFRVSVKILEAPPNHASSEQDGDKPK